MCGGNFQRETLERSVTPAPPPSQSSLRGVQDDSPLSLAFMSTSRRLAASFDVAAPAKLLQPKFTAFFANG